jgi:hypothetical protein
MDQAIEFMHAYPYVETHSIRQVLAYNCQGPRSIVGFHQHGDFAKLYFALDNPNKHGLLHDSIHQHDNTMLTRIFECQKQQITALQNAGDPDKTLFELARTYCNELGSVSSSLQLSEEVKKNIEEHLRFMCENMSCKDNEVICCNQRVTIVTDYCK